MKIKVHPSPSLIVRSDSTILECIQLMNHHQVGSVLVVNNKTDGELIGIFTERDLLNRLEIIRSGDHWNRPIFSIMTRPVHTLDISELEKAAELMIEKQMRHVPITIQQKNQLGKSLVGVVSMRDLFKLFIQNQKEGRTFFDASLLKEQKQITVDIVSKDGALVSFLEKTVHFFLHADTKVVSVESDILGSSSFLLIDLDGIDSVVWSKVLMAKNHDPKIKMLVVLFDPTQQSQEINQILTNMNQAEKFWILKKPIDLAILYEGLNRLKSLS